MFFLCGIVFVCLLGEKDCFSINAVSVERCEMEDKQLRMQFWVAG